MAEEYNRVFSNSLDAKKIAEAHKKDAAEITPSHVFGVLLFMKDHLVKEKNFKEAPLVMCKDLWRFSPRMGKWQ